jgi:dihydroflavonol-4-reductase
MDPNPKFWADKRVCVTGGAGFLGWQIVRRLLPLAAHVRLFGLPPSSEALRARLRSLDCVAGDVRDAGAVRRALRDCDVVFHTAATVAVWGPALKSMRDVHLSGTRNVLLASRPGARVVHTSSVMAVGAALGPESLTEDSPFRLGRLRVDYIQAKRGAEELALKAAASGRDVVVVNPAYLIGPQDYDGSIMGRFCLRAWKGKVKLAPPGGMNFVDVRDAARGHLLAAERGRSGRRYILGGENLTLEAFLGRLAAAGGLAARPLFRMPPWLQTLIACCAEVRGLLTGRPPYPSLQYARTGCFYWYYSSERARADLGYRARPIEETLADALLWFRRQGLLASDRVSLLAATPTVVAQSRPAVVR